MTSASPAVTAIALASGALASGAQTPGAHCDVQVEAGGTFLQDAVAKATTGNRLCLAPGIHKGGFALDKSLTVAGVAGSIIEGSGRGSVLRIEDDGLAIRLEGLTIRGGNADAGGGLAIHGRGKVTIADCTFAANKAGMVGGGGLFARGGLLQLERCTFDGNDGRQGGAVLLAQALKAEFTRCTFTGNRGEQAGAIRATEGIELALKACSFVGSSGQDGAVLRISGTKSRKPKISLDHCTIDAGTLINGPAIAGEISARNSTLPQSWKTAALDDRGHNTWK